MIKESLPRYKEAWHILAGAAIGGFVAGAPTAAFLGAGALRLGRFAIGR